MGNENILTIYNCWVNLRFWSQCRKQHFKTLHQNDFNRQMDKLSSISTLLGREVAIGGLFSLTKITGEVFGISNTEELVKMPFDCKITIEERRTKSSFVRLAFFQSRSPWSNHLVEIFQESISEN